MKKLPNQSPNHNKEIQQKRFLFLKHLYDITESDVNVYTDPTNIGVKLGYSSIEIDRVCNFLGSEGLIGFDIRDFVCITHNGVIEIEKLLSKSNEVKQSLFSTNYIVNIEQMTDSQLQQGSNQSMRGLTYSKDDIDALSELIVNINDQLPKLKLPEDAQAEIRADLGTLESQIKSPRPKPEIVKECLLSLRTILEGIAGNAIAAMLLQIISTLFQ